MMSRLILATLVVACAIALSLPGVHAKLGHRHITPRRFVRTTAPTDPSTVSLLQTSSDLSLKVKTDAKITTATHSSTRLRTRALAYATATQADGECTAPQLPPLPPKPDHPNPLINPKLGATCCDGMTCPFDKGVCCQGSTHCCPSLSQCVQPCDGCPFVCHDPDLPTPEPTNATEEEDTPTHRVVKVEVFNAQVKEPEPEFNWDQELDETRKKMLEEADKKREATDRVLSQQEESHKREAAKIAQIMQLAAGGAIGRKRRDATTQEEDKTLQKKGNQEGVVPFGYQQDQRPLGNPWPPLAAILNDGLGGVWVKEEQIDWLGYGVIRNGTTNIVTGVDDCKAQCEALQECRVFKFVYNTGECWLDSDMATTASACTLVQGKRDCVSYIKKIQRWDKNYEYGVVTSKDKDWFIVDQQNWLGHGIATEGGRLLRNGRRNRVENLTECIQQCADLKYCRAMLFYRANGECWLSSRVSTGGGLRCARRNGRRDCISYLKKKSNPERGAPAPAEVTVKNAGQSQTIQIENASPGSAATTLNIAVPSVAAAK